MSCKKKNYQFLPGVIFMAEDDYYIGTNLKWPLKKLQFIAVVPLNSS